MKCELCQVESNLDNHLSNIWYCTECSDKSFFKDLKNLYNTEKGKKILYVSSKINRLDQVSTFVMGGLDLFNVNNSIILVHAEGLINLTYPVDVAFIDDDAISLDYSSQLIKFNNDPKYIVVNKGWQTDHGN